MGLLPLVSSYPPGYFGSLSKCYIENLTIYRSELKLLSIPLVLLNAAYQISFAT